MSNEPVIVIIEDDPNIADLVELYLRRDGYRPYQASTGIAHVIVNGQFALRDGEVVEESFPGRRILR